MTMTATTQAILPRIVATGIAADTHNQGVLREQVKALYAMNITSVLADISLALILGITFYVRLDNTLALVWLGMHGTQILGNAIQDIPYYKDPQASNRHEYWGTVKSRSLLVHSISWALAPMLFLPPDNFPMAMFMMLIVLGLCSGGVPAVALQKRSLLSFCVPMIIGLGIALVWRGGEMYWVLAACSGLYLAATLHFAFTQHKLLTDALIMRFDKEALAEKLREQVNIAQRANIEKNRFFAAASHDLRQPLHAIALFGAVLNKELSGRPEHAHTIQLMHAVDALSVSLNSMLDVSQLDAGVIKPEIKTVPLSPLLEILDQMFTVRANEKGLQLRVRTSPLWIRTDMQLLQRLLANLIENALKYTMQGGVIVRAYTRGPQLYIDVRDTGIGIAVENRDSIFDEFYQIGNSGRDRAKGLGIGLALVRRIALLLGYSVQVHSRVGRGSRFRVILPHPLQPDKAAQPVPPQPIHLSALLPLPQRVLIIDDEADIRLAMIELLRLHGVAAVVVGDEAGANIAMQHAAESHQPFAALLCDYRLQDGVDGLAVAQRLRQTFSPALPLLIITGETSPEKLQRLYDLDIPVLFKPTAAPDLLQALADLIKR